MAEPRAWAWFLGGVAAGGAAIGTYMWRSRRRAPLGRIFRIKGDYYADSAVVEELLSRAPGAERYGKEQGGELFVYRRGRISFDGPIAREHALPGQVGPRLFQIKGLGDIESVVIDWIQFGLALPGVSFASWPTEQGGVWNPPPEPLHPTAFDLRRKFANASEPLRADPPRPIGHYFQVGERFYADGNFLDTLDRFRGADFDERASRTIVPFWRRGRLELVEQTRAKMLPEQVGPLYRIEAHLSGVSLPDLLVELEGLGLVFWGGQWPRFPERLPPDPPTGPAWPVSPRALEERRTGLVFEHDGFYLNAEALRRIRTRLPIEGDALTWQGTRLRFVPRADLTFVRVETASGSYDDDAIRSFIGQLLLHRIVERLELPADRPAASPVEGEG